MVKLDRAIPLGLLFLALAVAGCAKPPAPPGPPPPTPPPTERAVPAAPSGQVVYRVADHWTQVLKLHEFFGGEREKTSAGVAWMPKLFPKGLWEGNTSPIISAHPAYGEEAAQVGYTILQFPVTLPDKPTRLVFGAGLSPRAKASDGVEFKVTVDQEKVFDEVIEKHGLLTRSVDLTPYAGRDVNIELITGPGPKKNISFDWALWEDPRIVE
jgi:hypothetical protein